MGSVNELLVMNFLKGRLARIAAMMALWLYSDVERVAKEKKYFPSR